MQTIKTLMGLAAVLTLLACTRPITVDRTELARVGAAASLETCCNTPQKTPAITRIAESCALPTTKLIQNMGLRKSYLQDQPAAHEAVLAKAQPLDIFAAAFKGRLAGRLSLGYFSHVSVYVGGEKALRAAGVWDDAAVRPWHAQLKQGPMVIEAMAPEIALAGNDKIFDADAIAVMRPTGLTKARKRAALRDMFKAIGTPFDAHFDARTPEKLFCSELPARVIPELNLPVRTIYGRPTYLPDDTVAQTLQGKLPLRLALFVVGDATGWKQAGPQEVAARILEYWPKSGGAS